MLTVTYDTDPSGAVLYQGQQKLDYTPYTVTYPVSEEEEKQGFKTVPDIAVRWVSGASAELKSHTFDLKRDGHSQKITFQRPDSVPGREADYQFGLEVERTRAMQRQAAAQEAQAKEQRRQAEALEKAAYAKEQKEQKDSNKFK